MLSRLKKRIFKNGSLRKLVTGFALFMLIISRLLSNYNLIQEVHAAFEQDPLRGEISAPYIDDQVQNSKEYIDGQSITSKDFSGRTSDIVSVRQRAEKVENFYKKWNSPMSTHSQYIVETADHFGIDWRLIPAISIVESSGGVFCFKPYNAFGWGSASFTNFEHGIYTVTKSIAQRYGSDNPFVIAYTYCPANAQKWGAKVLNLMNQI